MMLFTKTNNFFNKLDIIFHICDAFKTQISMKIALLQQSAKRLHTNQSDLESKAYGSLLSPFFIVTSLYSFPAFSYFRQSIRISPHMSSICHWFWSLYSTYSDQVTTSHTINYLVFRLAQPKW